MDFGDGPRHLLAAGDSFLLANAPSYVLANDEHAFAEDGLAMFDWQQSDVAHHEGDDTILVAGSFIFDTSDAALLLDSLPRFLLIPSVHPSASVIRSTLQLIAPEITGTQIGAAILMDRLVDVLLVQVLRAALDQDQASDFGWISALTDPKIGKAIGLMHGNASDRWTLESLSSAVAMSRAAFSKRFKWLVGVAPLDYLLRWRMRVARDLLRRGSTVAAAATQVGYSSESAFGHAFKRLYGWAPKRYWKEIDDL